MNMKKTRNVNNPYAIFRVGDYEIRVLKTYKNPESEIKDSYARWYTAAKSANTFGQWEYGDLYKSEVLKNFRLISMSPEFKKAYF